MGTGQLCQFLCISCQVLDSGSIPISIKQAQGEEKQIDKESTLNTITSKDIRLVTRTTIATCGLFLLAISPMSAQGPYDPSVSQRFDEFVQGMQVIDWWDFRPGGGVSNQNALSSLFNPYGIAGTTVTHQEWERYQPFNSANHVFDGNGLSLTATLAGGVYPGGINSGQIWSKATFKPGVTGYNVYAFMVRMKVPSGVGFWSQAWFYTMQPGQDDGSEIDNPEIMNEQWQNQYDWTGFDHGPNAGSDIYSIKNNQWVWQPGMDFSADYHDYELVWTPDATYKYVDGLLVYAQNFVWSAPGAAQLGVALAVGSNEAGATGLQPNSASEFPSAISLQYIGIWAK